jgi:Na+-transporting methylmalonyl-CoA/oxaloacetate decarboxylase gamma subunit
LSVVLAGISLGWLGVGAVILVLFLLVVIEVWREAATTTKELVDVEVELGSARREASKLPGLHAQIDGLQGVVVGLEEERRRPRVGFEEVLEVLAFHRARMDLALKHRAMSSEVPAMPITRAAITADGAAELSAVAEEGIDLVREEPLAAVKGDEDDCGLGASEQVQIDGSHVRARFGMDALPPDLSDAIERQGSFNPQGYTLRLAGLCIAEYDTLSDDELTETRTSLKDATAALARTLVGGASPGSENPEN